MPLSIRRAGHRYRSEPEPGVRTAHAFSFSAHYDPANVSFGALLACNEERLAPGAGFAAHRHRDTEILTWVLEGVLAHRDDHGHEAEIRPGQLQYLSAGAGVSHSEVNAVAAGEPVRFLQFWLQPGEFGTEPAYAVRDVDLEAPSALLTPPGMLRRDDAALHLLRAPAYLPLPELPRAAYLYLHLTRGSLGFREADGPKGRGRELAEGDAVRITEGDALIDPTAGPDGAELLVWAMESPVAYG
ncbi:pirin family protein [Streptacidiphilus pinicola]|uniref:Pirin family protein n=1 Tax=Streptacidiphilus pinicola TaxID=2219663 RepID=A0A2X0I749_9ACTN|nr:pirin family protein [Streptacidiphilus pinicola]RAG80802.1 pirin family protein [Streptacidiphilus pinicola]